MAFADINGARLFYTDEGSGTPVLLVHGSGCDSFDWIYQMPALLDHYRVIAVDRRGHGHSSAPEHGYAPRQEAGDLAALLDKIGVTRAVAVGHSTGAQLVGALAVEHSERVIAIVPVDPSYGVNPAARQGLRDASAALDGPECHETFRKMIGRLYAPSSPAHLRLWHARRVYSVPPQVLAAVTRETALSEEQFFFSPETEDYLNKITCPALTIRRIGDGPSMADWDRAQFRNPYSAAVAWANCGHWPHQERPDEFNRILIDWIDGLPA